MVKKGISSFSLRLPTELNDKIKKASAGAGRAKKNAFIIAALENELARINYENKVEHPEKWGPLLARRALECAPTPIVVKSTEWDGTGAPLQPRIRWANLAYEDEFGLYGLDLRGKTIADLGLIDAGREDTETNILSSIATRDSTESMEGLSIKERGRVLYHALRFTFQHDSTLFLGDVSFNWGKMALGPLDKIRDLFGRIYESSAFESTQDLFMPFVEALPTALAIKDHDLKIAFCNRIYASLAGREPEDCIGETAQDLWNLPPNHPIMTNDRIVLTTERPRYCSEQLPGKGFRTSLRFPIPGPDLKPRFVAVISADFKLKAYQTLTLSPAILE